MDDLDRLIKSRGKGFKKKVDKALARREFERRAQQEYQRTGWVLLSKRFGAPSSVP